MGLDIRFEEYKQEVLREALSEWREGERLTTLEAAKLLYEGATEELAAALVHKDKAGIRKVTQKFQRRISYLETGRTSISEQLFQKLEDQQGFEGRLRAAQEKSEREALQIVTERQDFPMRQEKFLRERGYEYDFWFINAAAIPMFRDNQALLSSWSKNIRRGVSYHLIWDFSDVCFTSQCKSYWNVQVELLKEVIRDVESDYQEDSGAIEIFAFRRSILESAEGKRAVDGWVRKLEKWSSSLDTYVTDNGANSVLKIRPVFDLDEPEFSIPPKVSWFLTKFSYAGGATLAYVDNATNHHPLHVHLECNETLAAFGREKTEGVHVFFGDPHSVLFEECLEEFNQWADEHLRPN